MSGRNELCKPRFLVDDNAEMHHEASSHWLKEVLDILFFFLILRNLDCISMTYHSFFPTEHRKKNKRPEMVFIIMHASFKIK